MQSMLDLIQFLPFLEVLPAILPRNKQLMKNIKMRDDYATYQLEEHRKTGDVNSPRDYIDAYIAMMEQKKSKQEATTASGPSRFFLFLPKITQCSDTIFITKDFIYPSFRFCLLSTFSF